MKSPRDNSGTELEVGFEDAFGKHISDTTSNKLDLASHYPFSPDSNQNSVIETSTALTQAADSTGSVTTSTSNTGGFQLSYASLYSTGRNDKKGQVNNSMQRKRPIYSSDTVGFWGNVTDTGDITFEVTTEEDW